MLRISVIGCLLALGLVACDDGGLTLTEYAERLEEEVVLMNARIDEIDVQLQDPASVDEARGLWDERVAARSRLLGVFQDLKPPGNAEELHAAVADIIERLTAAEAALGARAAEVGSPCR